MKTVFADSAYWIALIRPDDQHQRTALDARRALGQAHLVTTEEVLVEFFPG